MTNLELFNLALLIVLELVHIPFEFDTFGFRSLLFIFCSLFCIFELLDICLSFFNIRCDLGRRDKVNFSIRQIVSD